MVGAIFYAFCNYDLNTEHWTLFTVDVEKKEISFFDSGLMFGLSKEIHVDAERLIKFLNEWEAAEGGEGSDRSQVDWEWSRKEVHQQINTFDCGIHTLVTCRSLIENIPLSTLLRPDYMHFMRRKLMIELFHGELQSLY